MTSTNNILTVLPDLTWAERVKRGNYHWVYGEVKEKNFPITADQFGEWEWKIFYPEDRQCLTTEKVIQLIKGDGFEPAQAGHMLAFGETFPEEQLEFPIYCVGSDVSGDEHVEIFSFLKIYDRDQFSQIHPGPPHGRRISLITSDWSDDWILQCHGILGVRRRFVT
jgi:hypothetical protein